MHMHITYFYLSVIDFFFYLFLRTRLAKILDISAQASITKHSSPPKSLPPAKTFFAGRLRVKFRHNDEK